MNINLESIEAKSDQLLISSILNGEIDEYRFLINRYKDRIFMIIKRQISDYSVAEDLSQETFVKAYRNLSQFRGDSKFYTWLTRIALNVVSTYFKSKKHQQDLRTLEFKSELSGPDLKNPELNLELKGKFKLLKLSLSKLDKKYREVLVLCSFENKKYAEVSTILGIPIGTVRSRLNSARLQLKSEMKLLSEDISKEKYD